MERFLNDNLIAALKLPYKGKYAATVIFIFLKFRFSFKETHESHTTYRVSCHVTLIPPYELNSLLLLLVGFYVEQIYIQYLLE